VTKIALVRRKEKKVETGKIVRKGRKVERSKEKTMYRVE
jgi:hypothetical protein